MDRTGATVVGAVAGGAAGLVVGGPGLAAAGAAAGGAIGSRMGNSDDSGKSEED